MGAMILLFLLAGLSTSFGQQITLHTFEERFGSDNVSVTSPRISEPGKNSFTFVQNDGTLSIGAGQLLWTAQSTPADGDLYLKSTSSFSRIFAQAFLFRYIPTTNGTGSGTTPGTAIGFSNGNPITGNMIDSAIGFDSPNLVLINGNGGSTRLIKLMTVSTDTTYDLAVISGGYAGNNDLLNTPYYTGQTGSSYLDGITVFVKVNNSPWNLLRKAKRAETSPLNLAVSNYNGAGKLDNIIVPEKTFASLMEPVNYVSCVATNGTQFFDITPEQGTAWDSLAGNLVVASNYIAGSGSAVGFFGYAAVKDFGTTDMYGEIIVDSDGAQFPRVMMRYDPADSTGLSLLIRGDTDELELYSVSWSTGVATLLGNVDLSSLPSSDWVVRFSCLGNVVRAWVDGASVYNTLEVTTTFNNTNTYFGFGSNHTSSKFKHIAYYYGGKEGQYLEFENSMTLSVAQRRGSQ